jgi:hypothetical protein
MSEPIKQQRMAEVEKVLSQLSPEQITYLENMVMRERNDVSLTFAETTCLLRGLELLQKAILSNGMTMLKELSENNFECSASQREELVFARETLGITESLSKRFKNICMTQINNAVQHGITPEAFKMGVTRNILTNTGMID